jgi:homospermidine synthase
MTSSLIRQVFNGRMLMLGFGCVGAGVLPLLLRHLQMRPTQLTVIKPHSHGLGPARAAGVHCLVQAITPDNYRSVLAARLSAGDVLVNLSVNASSIALLHWCREAGVLYLDTCIEPWAGGFLDPALSASQRSNHALREAALALRREGPAPTAVLTHGANPGLVSHFVKQALLNIAAATGTPVPAPATREGWAQVAQRLGIRVIHVAEHDTQVGSRRKALDEFVNTWSCEAFVDEGMQPAELGWGSHERHFPPDGAWHDSGTAASIYLQRPGAGTRVRSWTPLGGPMHGFLVTHAEAISIADYLTLGQGRTPAYRPTVHYVYHPCDDAVLSLHELAGRNWRVQEHQRLLEDDIASGIDELGVLLMGHARGAYWYGSRLSIAQARALAPHNNATSLQVAAGVLAGVLWALKHPQRGIVEPDEMPYDEVLALAEPYLGPMAGVYSDWTPLDGRGWPFAEDVDRDDPWQFKNFRVN